MLVFTREVNDTVVIGPITEPVDKITVMVTKVDKGHVGIGVEAPDHVPVHRLETCEAMLENEGEIRSLAKVHSDIAVKATF